MPPKKKNPELQLIEEARLDNTEKSEKVSQMENLVHDFDVQKILKLNERLRTYYKSKGDAEALELIDRMTIVMQELTEIINQVKSKRITLEQGQREIQEKLIEINEVLRTMKDWEATGL
jgi:hypothetical protein